MEGLKQRYFIELAYKGAGFHGWQVQPNAVSVQETLEEALRLLCREHIALTGAGRTDAGVHASYFVAHFDSENETLDQPGFCRRLNRFLNRDIVIFGVFKVQPGSHARFDAELRTYRYVIQQRKDPFSRETAWYCPFTLDVTSMNRAALLLVGRHDFTSFSRLHTDVKTNICTVSLACWEQEGLQLIFRISADRFLRNMVRAIVGTLVETGRGKLAPEEIISILEAKNRALAGASVPAEGLFLTDIRYPETIFCRSAGSSL